LGGWAYLLLPRPGHPAKAIPQLLLRHLPQVFPEIGSSLLALLLHDVCISFFFLFLGCVSWPIAFPLFCTRIWDDLCTNI
jgi:hypothetical protein